MIKDILVARYITNGNYKSQMLYESLGVRDKSFKTINPLATHENMHKTAVALLSLMNSKLENLVTYEKHLLTRIED
ncbi:MAG: hypothetical protein KBS34_05680 [Phascolarctobacterium sp.]|nr:hypothetical protein [Candidatus Phascolarctobacterium equi]